MPCCWPATPTAAARSSRPAPACSNAAHHAAGSHSVPPGCGALPRPTTVPSAASHNSTLVDCVEESTPATSMMPPFCGVPFSGPSRQSSLQRPVPTNRPTVGLRAERAVRLAEPAAEQEPASRAGACEPSRSLRAEQEPASRAGAHGRSLRAEQEPTAGAYEPERSPRAGPYGPSGAYEPGGAYGPEQSLRAEPSLRAGAYEPEPTSPSGAYGPSRACEPSKAYGPEPTS